MSQTIQNELNDLLNKFATNSVSQPAAADPFAPVLDATGTPVEPAPVTPEPPKAVEPVAPAATTAPPAPAPVEEGLIADWDAKGTPAPAETEPAPAAPALDLSIFAKELGREDIAKQEDVVNAVKELKQTAEALKSAPEDLVKAIEIAKAGGNYLEYLQVSVVDWAKEDPIVLYENYVEDQFYNPQTGLVDYEKVDKVLEKMDDEEKEFRGKELQKQYVVHQKQQQEFIRQQAIAKKSQFEQSVKSVLNEIKDVNGYVLSPEKKAELLDYVLSGQDLQENDVRSRVVNAFIKKNFSAIDKYMKTKVRNSTQREILEEAQIPEVKPSTTPAAAPSTKQYSINDWISDLGKQKGF